MPELERPSKFITNLLLKGYGFVEGQSSPRYYLNGSIGYKCFWSDSHFNRTRLCFEVARQKQPLQVYSLGWPQRMFIPPSHLHINESYASLWCAQSGPNSKNMEKLPRSVLFYISIVCIKLYSNVIFNISVRMKSNIVLVLW